MQSEALGRDAAFALLSNRRRRQLVCLLVQHEGTVSLRNATREIIFRLEGMDPEDVPDDLYRSVYVSLYQHHAPRLADAGIVAYDETKRTVRLAHNRRTRALLRLVGVEPQRAALGEWTGLVEVAAVGAVALVGSLAMIDPRWTGALAILTAGGLLLGGHRYVTRQRIPRTDDCGDLLTRTDSAAGTVDDCAHPAHRQKNGQSDGEAGRKQAEFLDEHGSEGGREQNRTARTEHTVQGGLLRHRLLEPVEIPQQFRGFRRSFDGSPVPVEGDCPELVQFREVGLIQRHVHPFALGGGDGVRGNPVFDGGDMPGQVTMHRRFPIPEILQDQPSAAILENGKDPVQPLRGRLHALRGRLRTLSDRRRHGDNCRNHAGGDVRRHVHTPHSPAPNTPPIRVNTITNVVVGKA